MAKLEALADLPGAEEFASERELTCFHCGDTLPRGRRWSALVDGKLQAMCCGGCQAAAEAIAGQGLTAYYTQRVAHAARPGGLQPNLAAYDAPALDAACPLALDGSRQVHLVLEGMQCAACAWLIESTARQMSGVLDATVNLANRQACVRWNPAQTQLSGILAAIWTVGYRAYPFDARRRQAGLNAERNDYLRRIGVAALFGMQVMMVTTALYFDPTAGGVGRYLSVLNWLNLAMTLPLILYAAVPFYRGAWRSLRAGHLGMDVPVSLGILLAFAGSAWHTAFGGAAYFDSIAMFVCLLLLARYLELAMQQRASSFLDQATRILPATVELINGRAGDRRVVTVPVADVGIGDRLLIKAGTTLPLDGDVVVGRSSVDESMLTGESVPVPKGTGDRVLSGSVNVASPLEIMVTAVGAGVFMARVAELIARAAAGKPRLAQLAGRVAGWFVAGVLSIATTVAIYQGLILGVPWLATTVAILVISCPCALALATPAALTSASAALLEGGVAILRPGALEDLAHLSHIVFDKTGTLTSGQLQRSECIVHGGSSEAQCVRIAAALEAGSEHPYAAAFTSANKASGQLLATDLVNVPGGGIEGTVDGTRYALGSRVFIAQRVDEMPARGPDCFTQEALLAADGKLLAEFRMQDSLRSEAMATVEALRAAGITLAVWSGDRQQTAERLAAQLGIADVRGEMRPESKLNALRALQESGAIVAVVGDGVNDAPMLAQAAIAIAVANAADQAKLTADLLLLRDDLRGVARACQLARRTRQIMHQNLGWALGYNLIALPLAIAGYVQPWLAALCMAFSSLVVTLNAARLRRTIEMN